MPGNRYKSFRSGDLNEEFGMFMLRLLGAVAPVPRTEDVGVDAFLTLLHDEGPFLSAGRTCMVQLKSDSVDTVTFAARRDGQRGISEFEWLKRLSYPVFFARVSVGQPLRIYTSNELLGWMTSHPLAKQVAVCFSPERRRSPEDDEDGHVVYLGTPILTVSLEDAGSPDVRSSCVQILDSWISLLTENLVTMTVGMVLGATWKTNEPLNAVARHIDPREPDPDLSETILLNAAKSLMPLVIERLYHGEEADLNHISGLLEAIDRDSPRFTFDTNHREFVKKNVEQLRGHRQRYRVTKGGILLGDNHA